jgi:hypothetical protein
VQDRSQRHLEVTGPAGRGAYYLTLHGKPTEPVLTHLTHPSLPIPIPLQYVHRRMWIMGVLCFLPVASTISLGWRAPSGNFPVGWDKIPASKSPPINNQQSTTPYSNGTSELDSGRIQNLRRKYELWIIGPIPCTLWKTVISQSDLTFTWLVYRVYKCIKYYPHGPCPCPTSR